MSTYFQHFNQTLNPAEYATNTGGPPRRLRRADRSARRAGSIWLLRTVASLCALTLHTHAVLALSGTPVNRQFMADELLVSFEPSRFSIESTDPAKLTAGDVEILHSELKQMSESLAQNTGLVLLDTSPVLRGARFRIPDGSGSVAQWVSHLDSRPGISFAEKNGISHLTLTEAVNDPLSVNQDWHFSLIGAQRAWDTVPYDYTVRVAVIDTGYRFDHPDAAPNVSTTDDYDFVSAGGGAIACNGVTLLPGDWDGLGPDADATDDMQLVVNTVGGQPCVATLGKKSSHGTMVAGVINAQWGNNKFGVGGFGRAEAVRPNNALQLIPIKVFNAWEEGTDWDITQGILYAGGYAASNGAGGVVWMQRVDIANMSFGVPTSGLLQRMAILAADAAGVLLISGAGNDASALPSYPAAYSQVVAVSNLSFTETLSASSNFGVWIELTAPGTTIGTMNYNFVGCAAMPFVPCNAANGGQANFVTGSGGSFAGPHVAAIAALYKAHNQSLSNLQLRAMLNANAADWGTPGFDIFYGNGLVQAAPGSGTLLFTARGPVRVALIDAWGGNTVATTLANAAGQFNFPAVAPGDYYVVAASDEDGDGEYGETGEGVAALRSPYFQDAQVVTKFNAGPVNGMVAANVLGWPGIENEPANDSMNGASPLFIGYYAESTTDPSDEDWYRVIVPTNGDYRIWTEGRNSVLCRDELGDYQPKLELFDAVGAIIDSDLQPYVPPTGPSPASVCAEIEINLSPGKYYVRLTAAGLPQLDAKTIIHFDRK